MADRGRLLSACRGFKSSTEGSNPSLPAMGLGRRGLHALVAQRIEHLVADQGAACSSHAEGAGAASDGSGSPV